MVVSRYLAKTSHFRLLRKQKENTLQNKNTLLARNGECSLPTLQVEWRFATCRRELLSNTARRINLPGLESDLRAKRSAGKAQSRPRSFLAKGN